MKPYHSPHDGHSSEADKYGVMRALMGSQGQPPPAPLTWPQCLSLPGWKHFARTWVMGLAQALAASYIAIVNLVNSVPAQSELITWPIRVVATQRLPPHLSVDVAGVGRRQIEFATVITPRGADFYGLSPSAKKRLPGCQGQVQIVPLRLTVSERYRVWSMNCGDTQLSFETTATSLARQLQHSKWTLLLYLVGASLITAFVYRLDLKESKGEKK